MIKNIKRYYNEILFCLLSSTNNDRVALGCALIAKWRISGLDTQNERTNKRHYGIERYKVRFKCIHELNKNRIMWNGTLRSLWHTSKDLTVLCLPNPFLSPTFQKFIFKYHTFLLRERDSATIKTGEAGRKWVRTEVKNEIFIIERRPCSKLRIKFYDSFALIVDFKVWTKIMFSFVSRV